jgi:tRNA(Ile)-lysidine synthase
MLNSFKNYCSANNLIKPDDKVLLAVSGGIDSMVMTHLFIQHGIKSGIAHCNFSLRADESDKDEAMVRQFANENNIPFFTEKFDTISFAKKNNLSIQMAARELRYTWFEEIRKMNGFDSVALAHNLNDNIETLILNLTRGTGTNGLTGMRPLNGRLIRPLLFATRKSIEVYCKQNGISYREDKSNAETKYTRNKIRHLIIPVLKEINPSIETTLNETAERFAGITEIVNDFISELKGRVSTQKNEIITFDIRLLKEYLSNKSVLFELFKPYGITNLQLNDLINIIQGNTGSQVFTPSHRIIKNRKELIVSGENSDKSTFYECKNITGLRKAPFIGSAKYIDISDKFRISTDSSIACIDADKVSFPLIIRKWQNGDHFHPLGMDRNKKLSDYFIDMKYSRFTKENILLLESGGEIVWIIGDRIDNRFKITQSSKKALVIKGRSIPGYPEFRVP